jgi:hypothetical protein
MFRSVPFATHPTIQPLFLLLAPTSTELTHSLTDSQGHNGRRLSGYPAVGYEAFGSAGRAYVHFFHKCTLCGVCTLYLILTSGFIAGAVIGEDDDKKDEKDKWASRVILMCAAFELVSLSSFFSSSSSCCLL